MQYTSLIFLVRILESIFVGTFCADLEIHLEMVETWRLDVDESIYFGAISHLRQ